MAGLVPCSTWVAAEEKDRPRSKVLTGCREAAAKEEAEQSVKAPLSLRVLDFVT